MGMCHQRHQPVASWLCDVHVGTSWFSEAAPAMPARYADKDNVTIRLKCLGVLQSFRVLLLGWVYGEQPFFCLDMNSFHAV